MEKGIPQNKVGVVGARSMVGSFLLARLVKNNISVIAFSRKNYMSSDLINWQKTDLSYLQNPLRPVNDTIGFWIFLAPILALPDYFKFFEASGAKRVVVISSTSCFTKSISEDIREQEEARSIIKAEMLFRSWAEKNDIEWVLLRPTLIYSLGEDKNISSIMRLIKKLRFFPIFGKAEGLRQPVHADDVAAAAYEALLSKKATFQCYNITGGEVLTYREMVSRIFVILKKQPRFFPIPLFIFKIVLFVYSYLSRNGLMTLGMVQRMNTDQVFDYVDAARDLNYKPRGFLLSLENTSLRE